MLQLDTSCDGYVDWNEFCTYMLLLYREQDYLRAKQEMPFMVEPVIRHIVHNRVSGRLFVYLLFGIRKKTLVS